VKGEFASSALLMRAVQDADVSFVRRDISPVVAAQALLAHGVAVSAVLAYVQRTWGLSEVDAGAASAAGRLLVGRDVRYAHDDHPLAPAF
jgi:hypothetical protein